MTEQVLARVNRTTLRAQALEHLRDGILTGTIPSGTRLAEVDLSTQLGVSRGTVREALRTLQESGLVEEADRGGMRVRRLSSREVRELFQVRLALEKEALVGILAQPKAQELVDELEKALPEEPEGGFTVSQRLDVDLGFHEKLCELAGNSMLLAMWRQLKDLVRVVILTDAEGENQALMKRAYHQPIIDGLRSGDANEAKAAMRRHMEAASAKWAERGAYVLELETHDVAESEREADALRSYTMTVELLEGAR